MRKKIFLGIAFFNLMGVLAIAQTPESIGNFGMVVEHVYRGARLNEEADYKALADLGVNTVISLEKIRSDSQKLCKKYGLTCKKFPILLPGLPDVDKYFDYEMLKRAFQFLVQEVSEGETVYIHCFYGSDRTGALASAVTVRSYACGEKQKDYDPDAIWELVESDLTFYGFHDALY